MNIDKDMAVHIWLIDSFEDWSLVYGDPKDAGAQEAISCASWPELPEDQDYASCYDSQHKRQLLVCRTEALNTPSLRAAIQAAQAFSPEELSHALLKVQYLLLRETNNIQWQEYDSWLQCIQNLTSSLDLNELLQNIMQNMVKAISAIDRGFLMLYDAEQNRLVAKASTGLGPSIYEFSARIGEGLGGKAFLSGVSQIYNLEAAMAGITDLSPDNMKNLMNALLPVKAEDMTAAAAVPVRMKQEIIGAVVVHQFRKKQKITQQDIRLLQGFADLAAIAISNATLFTELRETNRRLEKRNQIHDVFTKLSFADKDLVKIVIHIEKMLNLPLALVDVTKNEWHPPNSPLARDPAFYGISSEPVNSSEALTVNTAEGESFYLYPILNEGIILGYFVVGLLRPLQPLDIVILEQGEAVVVLEMLNTYSVTERNYKRSYAFYQELLHCQEPKLLAARCGNYGLKPELPLFVIVLQLANKEETAKRQEVHLRRLIAQLQNVLTQNHHLLFCTQNKITILVHAANNARQSSLFQELKAAAAWLENSGTPLFQGGVGNLYEGLENIAKSTWEADNALLYLMHKDKPGMMFYQDIGINRLFLNQQPWEIQQFIQDILKPLRTPAAQAAGLEQTLKAYIATNRSSSLTANRLHIHQNTLYHRLGKIQDALSVNLNDPDDLLKLHLACHLDESY